jgi:NAD(P)-dependent dehydrogenase (short-subunit alcohol dehydrogenase family)
MENPLMTSNEASLAGRVALVSGGGRGIGRAIVERLHAAGASVVVADSGAAIDGRASDAPPEPVAAAVVVSLGERAAAFDESIATADGAARAVELAKARFGAIDIVVHSAAILRDGFVWKGSPADFDAVVQNNLSAAYYLLHAAAPHLREQAKSGRGNGKWGRIIHIVSTAGFYGNYGQAAYASSKAGLLGLMRVAAHDLLRSGVTANAIAPFAATRVTESIKPADDAQRRYKEGALRVPAAPVADLCAHLCSDAAVSVSGQLFGVRGRELFLFSQPRPIARAVAPATGWNASELTSALTTFTPQLSELVTDLDAFSTEPLL